MRLVPRGEVPGEKSGGSIIEYSWNNLCKNCPSTGESQGDFDQKWPKYGEMVKQDTNMKTRISKLRGPCLQRLNLNL